MLIDITTFPLVFGLMLLSLAITLACVRLRRLSFNVLEAGDGVPDQNVELTVPERGLDEDTLNTYYPKLLYSEVLKKESNNNNLNNIIISDPSNYSSCSICLGDYKESDTLRLLPDCGHLYHVNCVDPWLKLHPTCPMCRTSSSVRSMEDSVIIAPM